ncbi:MAG: TlpA family protein disulfide reductase [Methylococcales bacterium]
MSVIIKKFVSNILLILLAAVSLSAHGETELIPFVSGSYQEILANNANNPFMLVVWSINCSSCLKDLEQLNDIQTQNPGIKIIMLAVDELSDTDKIERILKQQQLDDTERWVFAEENSQKLRFEIDPKWYGEIPRAYFFDSAHHRTGVSGLMSREDYDGMLAKISE